MRTLLLFTLVCGSYTSLLAQTKATVPHSPQYYAELRVKSYADAVDLTQEQADALLRHFVEAEKGALESRAMALQAQQEVDALMAEADKAAMSQLTKEQRLLVEAMIANGTFMPEVLSCVPAKGSCPRGYDHQGRAVPPAKEKMHQQREHYRPTVPELSPAK